MADGSQQSSRYSTPRASADHADSEKAAAAGQRGGRTGSRVCDDEPAARRTRAVNAKDGSEGRDKASRPRGRSPARKPSGGRDACHDEQAAHTETTGSSRSRSRAPDRGGRRALYDALWPEDLRRARPIAKYCPLVAAIAAPFATLMDIPALTEHWYEYNGVTQSDPTVNLVLSALELALSFIANALLIVRFSSQTPFWWRTGTRLSLVLWIVKSTVALCNLIVFGATTRNGGGYTYAEGFWAAVVSLIVSGFVTMALIFHYIFAFGKDSVDRKEVRQEGRKFMISVTAFMVLLALQSLVFCKIENWAYLDSIYFSVQTALTIGYGDFAPTTTAGKVLVFPFAVLTISQLGNEISVIISYISSRADARRDKWRKRYEGAMHREANRVRPHATLTEEMALVHQINKREETMSQLYDLLWSAFALFVFWLLGALMFSEIEGWTYGNAVYAVVILSTTIGFGDFTPVTPAGRVVWIVYALMAVPIVTSFAVQTVTGILSTYTQSRFDRQRFREERARDPDAFAPHSQYVQNHHKAYKWVRDRLVGGDDEDWLPGAEGRGTKAGGGEDDGVGRGKESGADEEDEAPVDRARAERKAKRALDEEDEAQHRHDEEKRRREEDEDAEDDGNDEDVGSGGAGESDDTRVDERGGRSADAAREKTTSHKDGDSAKREPRRRGASSSTGSGGSPVRWDADGEEAEGSALDEGRLSPSDQDKDRQPAARMNRHFEEQDDKIQRDEGRVHDEQEMGAGGSEHGDEAGGDGDGTGQTKKERDLERDLLHQLVNRVVQLEAEARQMLLDSMDKGLARTVLLADRNIQMRDVRQLRGDDANLAAIWRGEEDQRFKDAEKRDQQHDGDDDAEDMLARVRRYRQTFAEVLVLSSILEKLEGEDLNKFERWREVADTASLAEEQQTRDRGKLRHPRRRHCQRHRDEEECDCDKGGSRRDESPTATGRSKSLLLRLTRTEGDRPSPPTRGDPGDGAETLEDVADERYSGLTGRLFKHHTKKIRKLATVA